MKQAMRISKSKVICFLTLLIIVAFFVLFAHSSYQYFWGRDDFQKIMVTVYQIKSRSKNFTALSDFNLNVQSHDANRVTPLMAFARLGDASAVNLLLLAGADANLTNSSGKTAENFAQDSGFVEVAEIIRKSHESKTMNPRANQ